MGYPMAGYLAGAGHEVTVFNRTGSKAQTWANEYAGETAATPAAAASGADIVFTCVGNDDDVREVILGEQGALGTMSSGQAGARTLRDRCKTGRWFPGRAVVRRPGGR
jgi:3-hydroxyisobutyrate dehydrogenase-like beta-hydroxyacid dehydrogenase